MLTFLHSIWDGLAGVVSLVLVLPVSAGLAWLRGQNKTITTAVLAVLVTLMCWSLLEPLGNTLYRRVTLLGSFTAFDGSFSARQAMQNAALFIPFGAIIACHPPARGREYRAAIVAGLGLSVLMETVQFLAVPGRNADLSDVAMNVTGTAVGVLWAMLAWRTFTALRNRSREGEGAALTDGSDRPAAGADRR